MEIFLLQTRSVGIYMSAPQALSIFASSAESVSELAI